MSAATRTALDMEPDDADVLDILADLADDDPATAAGKGAIRAHCGALLSYAIEQVARAVEAGDMEEIARQVGRGRAADVARAKLLGQATARQTLTGSHAARTGVAA